MKRADQRPLCNAIDNVEARARVDAHHAPPPAAKPLDRHCSIIHNNIPMYIHNNVSSGMTKRRSERDILVRSTASVATPLPSNACKPDAKTHPTHLDVRSEARGRRCACTCSGAAATARNVRTEASEGRQ